MVRISCAALMAGATSLVLALAPVARSNAADTATSVWQGVYTKAQAARGQATYLAACASCHGTQLQGDTDSPDLAGNAFLRRWTNLTVGALFVFAESQMPVGRPRSLGAQGYADVTAHILATNGFPDGQQELPPNGTLLDRILIDRKR
jgi:mono/diheme cytochrome c family protein